MVWAADTQEMLVLFSPFLSAGFMSSGEACGYAAGNGNLGEDTLWELEDHSPHGHNLYSVDRDNICLGMLQILSHS